MPPPPSWGLNSQLPQTLLLAMAHITTGQLLHQTTPTSQPRAAILLTMQCLQLTFSPTILTNQCFHGPPVTPSDMHHWCIALSITNLTSLPSGPPTTQYHELLIAQFHQLISPWQCPLFGPIHQLQPTKQLLHLNHSQQPLNLVSDTSVQNNSQSSFSRVIASQDWSLWQGLGLAQDALRICIWGAQKPSVC